MKRMDCPNCGKQNSGDSPLCSSCGWVLCWGTASQKADRRRARRLIKVALILLVVLLLPILVVITTAERGFTIMYIDISDESMAPYQSIYEVDRKAMGFPTLPSEGTVKVAIRDRESRKHEYDLFNYDVGLQFYEISHNSHKYTARFIALVEKNGSLEWFSESMSFHGPKEYICDESLTAEYIHLKCETGENSEDRRGITATVVSYSGPDERLIREKGIPFDGGDLSLEDVIPILREWGYVYEVAGFEGKESLRGSEDE